MNTVRIALANVRVPVTPNEWVLLATSTVADAGRKGALVVCFPECFVPGYRWPGITAPPPDAAFLERAWAEVAQAARTACITVILGTERVTDRGLQISACVINPDGTVAGWQDKGQLDPLEEATYPVVGTERSVFTAGPLTRCSAFSRTDKRACSWRTWTSVRPPDFLLRGAGPRRCRPRWPLEPSMCSGWLAPNLLLRSTL